MTAPRRLPNSLTHATPSDMYGALDRAWVKKFDTDPRPEQLLVLLAQWALETGRGASMHAWNVGNVKGRIDGSDGHSWTFFSCDEVINGKVVWFHPDEPGCCFRAYDTLEEGVADYLEELWRRFHSAWTAVLGGDPGQFGHLLKLARYYTAKERRAFPGDTPGYCDTLEALFREFKASISSSYDLHSWRGIQGALNALGEAPLLTVDNDPGPLTLAALRRFQRKHGLVVDADPGANTIMALSEALAAIKA